jgi:hypothetical protein
MRRPHRLFVSVVVALLVGTPAGAGFAGGRGQQPPANMAAPTISGVPAQGQTLTGNIGSWSGVSNIYAAQWLRCDLYGNGCAAISGATATTYKLGGADVGGTIRLAVTATNKNGSATATSNPTSVVAPAPAPPAPPTNTALPQVSGTLQVGNVLSTTTGSWNGSPTSYGYQWQRCDGSGANCATIAGATAPSYTLASADAGATLRAAVTATNGGGSTTATSAPTGAVAAAVAPANTVLPQVSGTTQAGLTLTTSDGTWSGSPTSYAYQWKRCDSLGANCALVTGATAKTYVLSSTDVGSTMRASVSATNSGGTTTAVSTASAAVASAPSTGSSSRFGMATGGSVQNLSATDLARYLDGVKAAGAKWLRIDINWAVIQAGGPTSYNWGPFDNVVNAARARGLTVLGGILYTPGWARAAGTSGTYPPTNLSDYVNFAKTAATHYGALGVHAYEIWNEPNINAFWMPGPDPARYTQLLKLSYAAIKQADPTATVISAGLSPYGSYGQADAGHMNPVSFLEKMYANGAAGNMDAVGWHPYNYPYGLGFYVWSAWSQMSETSPSARSVMTAIWPTEFGAPTGSTSNSMTEAGQAQLVTDAYTKLKAWSWAGPAFFYSYRDVGTDKTNVEDNYGIIHYDWSVKLAYAAYQAAAAVG